MDDKVKPKITVETEVFAPVDKVWQCWTSPEDIIHWNYASPDWHSPRAINNLTSGGSFSYRMESLDGSMGFDFSGKYNRVIRGKEIDYTMDDGRHAVVTFLETNIKTRVIETFEAESVNTLDLQRTGWQAILNNFKKYTESKY